MGNSRGMKVLASLIALTLAAISPAAQAQDVAAVAPVSRPALDYEAELQRTLEGYDSTGMVASVLIDGEMVYLGALGTAEEGSNRPVTTDMAFPIASISKAFTTTALAILVDRGKVDWDAPVRRYIPEFAMYDPWVSEHFTVRDALTHRSGLPLGAGDLLIWPDGNAAPADVIAALPHLRPSTGFRDGYAYDNLLYIVAGEIVERVSGDSWADFVTDELLVPIGLTGCAAQMDRIPEGMSVVTGHERAANADAGVPVDERLQFSPTWSAAGGIFCTAGDMMTWAKFWLDDGVTQRSERLLSEAQLAEVWTGVTPVSAPGFLKASGSSHLALYSLGWFVQDYEGTLMVRHSGGAPGVVSNLILLPEKGIAIFASSNDYRPAAHSFTYHIANALIADEKRDLIADLGAAFRSAEQNGEVLIADMVQAPGAPSAPDLALPAYAGTYRDAWYGAVHISQDADGLFIDMSRSEILDGALTHISGNRFAAFWPDSSLKADAYVDFLVEDGAVTGLTMQAISDLTDFSYDFHDLQLQRVN